MVRVAPGQSVFIGNAPEVGNADTFEGGSRTLWPGEDVSLLDLGDAGGRYELDPR